MMKRENEKEETEEVRIFVGVRKVSGLVNNTGI
jgi:hypothetical protein